jgi:hypothetical protein
MAPPLKTKPGLQSLGDKLYLKKNRNLGTGIRAEGADLHQPAWFEYPPGLGVSLGSWPLAPTGDQRTGRSSPWTHRE